MPRWTPPPPSATIPFVVASRDVSTCPCCPQTFPVSTDSWNWPYIYSQVLLHLDREHPTILPAQRTEIAEHLADAITAEALRRKLTDDD